jgi:hypothetical protein
MTALRNKEQFLLTKQQRCSGGCTAVPSKSGIALKENHPEFNTKYLSDTSLHS